MTNTIRQFHFARGILAAAFLLVACNLLLVTLANGQSRDFMTEEEVEIVRDAQEIDSRIDVIVRMIDRRFKVMNVEVASPWTLKKERSEWGALPTGERDELYSDIRKLLDKAISDIDNLNERPDAAILPDPEEKNPRTFKEMFPKAVRTLADAAARYKPVLEKEFESSNDTKIKDIISRILEDIDDITNGAAKIPPPEPKKPKKT